MRLHTLVVLCGTLLLGSLISPVIAGAAPAPWQDEPVPAEPTTPAAQEETKPGDETETQEPTETTDAPATGDQSAAVDTAADADKSFTELLADWETTFQQLQTLEQTARAEGATEEAKATYINAVDEAYQLLSKLEAAAAAELEADGANQRAAEVLVGIMVNASRKSGSDRDVLMTAEKLFAADAAQSLLDKALDSTRLQPFGKELFREVKIRLTEATADNLPRVKLATSKGEIVLELFEDQSANTVANFISLVKSGKYAGVPFHRVIDGFMAQTGDFENKDGSGGPGYTIACECVRDDHRNHFFGSLSMAHAGQNTGGSQFFICFGAPTHLDGKHTVFGRVASGFDVLDSLTRTHTSGLGGEAPIPGVVADTIVSAEVIRDRGHEYQPETKPDEPPAAGSGG